MAATESAVVRYAPFPRCGQGVFTLTVNSVKEFSITITPDKPANMEIGGIIDGTQSDFQPTDYIKLSVAAGNVSFYLKMDGETTGEEKLNAKVGNGNTEPEGGIESGTLVSYWFSYDRDGLALKYGKGHVMEETTLMSYDFHDELVNSEYDLITEELKEKALRKKYQMFFNANSTKTVILSTTEADSTKAQNAEFTPLVEVMPCFQFRRMPLVLNFPAVVMDSSKVTLFDLDREQFMYSSALPSACKELYENIKNIELEYPENPVMKFSDAIRYSIETPGKTLYNKLEEKGQPFSYLRVTLGPNRRVGPGVPYVMEIWPKDNGSPIHNHGNTCAIIKNLFGRIRVNVFNKMRDPPTPDEKELKYFGVKEGQITWISPDWYQTHKLYNNSDDFCATIQCYRYSYDDKIMWPGFDYDEDTTDDEDYLGEFYPDSDYTFMELRRIVYEEYEAYLSGRDASN